jgi:hypothetical protein
MATKTKKALKPKAVAGTGGDKGSAVLDLIKKHPDWTRAQIAEAVGCTPQRVGEVVRAAVSEGVTEAFAFASARRPAKGVGSVKGELAKSVAKAKQAKAAKSVPASDAEVYKHVMSGLAAGSDDVSDSMFDRAVAYAKRTKKRAPKRG